MWKATDPVLRQGEGSPTIVEGRVPGARELREERGECQMPLAFANMAHGSRTQRSIPLDSANATHTHQHKGLNDPAPAELHHLDFAKSKIFDGVLVICLEPCACKRTMLTHQIRHSRLNSDVETSNQGCLDKTWVPQPIVVFSQFLLIFDWKPRKPCKKSY